MADRGSTTKSGVTVALLKRLDVALNICEGARSKGTVECAHRWWEERFESRFRTEVFTSIEQLNDWAVDFAARINAEEEHTRTGSTRTRMWEWYLNRRPESTLREIACDFETFKMIALTEPQICKVNNARLIRFKSQRYRVPNDILPGAMVAVQFSPFTYPQIQVRFENDATGQVWTCDPISVDEFGFEAEAPIIGQEFKSQPHTRANTFAKEARAGYKELFEKTPLQAFGYHIDKVTPSEVRPATEDVPLSPVAESTLTKFAARQAVIELIGRTMTQPEAQYVSQQFGERVTEAEIAAAVNQIQKGITGRVYAFPAGGSR
jgi:hypothetical protein